jgi:2-methyl-3-hydroxypyridine 5-carboxylic acid dioxygenase
VRVHERGPIPREDGAGIFLWENGLLALEALGAHRLLEGRTYAASQWEDRDGEGRQLAVRPFPLPGGLRMVTLSRRDLHAALIERSLEAGVEIVNGSSVAAAQPDGALVTADGARWAADLAVAADGIHSAARSSLDVAATHHRFEEFLIFRFLVALARAPGSEGVWRNYVDYWDFERRRRVLYVPCNQTDLYVMLSAGSRDPAAALPLEVEPWRESFPALRDVLEAFPPGIRRDSYEAMTLPRWSLGRAAIVGDAAHAMPPTIGQGAGTAMMNALSLAVALDREEDVEAALAAWEQAERPATEQAQRTSVERVGTLFPARGQGHAEWASTALEAARRTPPRPSARPVG